MRFRPLLRIYLALAVCCAPLAAASAQTGLVYLYTHLANGQDAPILRTFLQTANGPQEIFTQEFTPGTYTFSRVDAEVGSCRASASNVTFTITANHWTTVDVPVVLQDCAVELELEMEAGGGRSAIEAGAGIRSVGRGQRDAGLRAVAGGTRTEARRDSPLRFVGISAVMYEPAAVADVTAYARGHPAFGIVHRSGMP